MSEDWIGERAQQEPIPTADLRTDVAHGARMYNYYLGGKDNFPADREAAERIVQAFPQVPIGARANRRFLGRAMRYAAESGIRRFLDIGTGIPAAGNTHEVAQQIAPQSRVVYVDNDPIVLAHARALLRGSAEGHTSYLQGDFKEPEKVLAAPETAELIKPGEPVALLLVALLHFFADEDDPQRLVRTVVDALPSGSLVVLTHVTADFISAEDAEAGLALYRRSGVTFRTRSRAEIGALLEGLEPVGPGLVPVHTWRPTAREDLELTPELSNIYAVAARKP